MEKCHLYIVLTRTNTVISKLIQVFKNDEYTHAAIALDRRLDNMYSFGRKHTYNPFVGRFRQECIHKGIYRFHRTLPGVILEVEVTKQQYERVEELLNHFISNSYLYKYNYMGLIHGLINKESYCDYRFLCSEFVYYILKESGITDFKISRNLVRPQKFLNLEGKIIYNGNLKLLEQQKSNEIGIRKLGTIY